MSSATATGRRRGLAAGITIALVILLAAPAFAGKKKEEKERRISTSFKLAQTYYANNRYGEALDKVQEILAMDPKYAPAHQLKGQILFSMEEIQNALVSFDRVLKLDKKYTEARNWKAFALVQLERYDEAMMEYERALKDLTYPTPEKIHLNIGMLHRLMGENDKAVTSLEESVRLNPSYVRGFYELGVTHQSMGNTGQARRYFESVIKLAPEAQEAAMARDELAKLLAAS